MLVRLQSAIGRDNLTEQMVLLPERKKPFSQEFKSPKIIVAYHGSPNSHTALDIALCIAQQTRLATNVQVNVQAVYVVENQHNQFLNSSDIESQVSQLSQSHLPTPTPSNSRVTTQYLSKEYILPLQQADRVLWQARSLAEEWQSYFKSHLRFGCVAKELKNVVELEAADILFLGCKSAHHTMVQMLGSNFPCAVLGIPHSLNE
ncbi:universal stress protein [Anabaenopsis elenkinii]|uniref:Universal stress protein n=1 Tax=Anabaenopsis elenkinii CCIBt3563 TaxID=2779889 RepID=A0A7S6U5Q8_9CYAN|nr:universal stress protein [Anabaenopsis elenkinii CCIBt3563]